MASVASISSPGINPEYSGVFTTAGATALTRILFGANSMARLWVKACKPAFCIEYQRMA